MELYSVLIVHIIDQASSSDDRYFFLDLSSGLRDVARVLLITSPIVQSPKPAILQSPLAITLPPLYHSTILTEFLMSHLNLSTELSNE